MTRSTFSYAAIWRYATAGLVTLALVMLAITAGKWQYSRYEQRRDAVAAYNLAQTLPPATLSAVDTWGGDHSPVQVWQHLQVTGSFIPQPAAVVRNRSINGVASSQYLAWLKTEYGFILVNLGWVPRQHEANFTPPVGEWQLTGIFREWEPSDGQTREVITRINPTEVTAPNGPILPGYLMARTWCSTNNNLDCIEPPIAPVPVPQLDLGPHLSYAWQWWVLAALLPLAVFQLMRPRRTSPVEQKAGTTPVTANKHTRHWRPGQADADVEDAL